MDAICELVFRVIAELILFVVRVVLEAVFELLSWSVFQLIWTPLFYGPGWLVCFLTPFWRERSRRLLREPLWAAPRADQYSLFFSDAANTVALIGFCATIVIGGATYGAYLLRG